MADDFDLIKEQREKKLAELKEKAQEEEAERLAAKANLPYLNLKFSPINEEAVGLIPEADARKAKLAVFYLKNNDLKIALSEPENPVARKIINDLKERKFEISLFFVSQNSLNKAFEVYKKAKPQAKEITGAIELSIGSMTRFQKELKNIDQIKKEADKLSGSGAKQLLELFLGGSLATDASDIHLEPTQENVRTRFRLDGFLQDIADIKSADYKLLLSRIKLLSRMKLNITNAPQDGRFSIKTQVQEIEVRVSALPGPYGENIVMRVLNPKTIALELKDLGLSKYYLEKIDKQLNRPNGMILVTGPTGSGKTTTLYAFLKKLNEPGVKIITLEDPIEYHLKGIEQTQVETKRGYDFANGLRSILRQDPDIILVGEIRDLETAETALHAALTGHLVFSTLHTNDAIGVVPRLIDLGAQPQIIAPAINVSVAQRLVRRVCGKCSFKSPAKKEELEIIEQELKNLPKEIKVSLPKKLELVRVKACPQCNNTGYKGRIAVMEMIEIDDDFEKLITERPTEFQIKDLAVKKGFISMKQDGVLKILDGITTLEELERVVG